MQRVLEWGVRRVIDTVPIVGDYVAYRERICIGGGLPQEKEGVTTNQMIWVQLDEPIVNVKTTLRKHVEGEYALYKSSLRETVRTTLWSSEGFTKQWEESLIKNPYTYITEKGMEGVELLCASWYDHNLYDLGKVVQPKAMHFDYINAHMNNRCYNLEEVVKVLEKRNDIVWLDSRRPWERNSDDRIFNIPYYNAEEGYTHYLEFMWTPTDEDFAKVRDRIHDMGRHDAVCKDVFGLTKLNSY